MTKGMVIINDNGLPKLSRLGYCYDSKLHKFVNLA